MATSAGFDGDYTKCSDHELWEMRDHWYREASRQNIWGDALAPDTDLILTKITAICAEIKRRRPW